MEFVEEDQVRSAGLPENGVNIRTHPVRALDPDDAVFEICRLQGPLKEMEKSCAKAVPLACARVKAEFNLAEMDAGADVGSRGPGPSEQALFLEINKDAVRGLVTDPEFSRHASV